MALATYRDLCIDAVVTEDAKDRWWVEQNRRGPRRRVHPDGNEFRVCTPE